MKGTSLPGSVTQKYQTRSWARLGVYYNIHAIIGYVMDKTFKNKILNLPRYTGKKVSEHSLYRCWASMKNRCYNKNDKKNYIWYGGRGIKVCDRWIGENGFWNFVDDMGPRPDGCSLDRIDPNGDYTPENCRWATAKEQADNRRTSLKSYMNGELVTPAEMSKITGLNIATIRKKIRDGMSGDDISLVKSSGKPRGVVCVETGEVFNSIAEAAEAHGMKAPTSISSVLAGRAHSAYGLHWRYAENADEIMGEIRRLL